MENTVHDVFEAALRNVGVQRLRLDQVVTVYHKAFPAEAMRADMRQRLHDAIVTLLRDGAITIPDGIDPMDDDPTSLPLAVELVRGAQPRFLQ